MIRIQLLSSNFWNYNVIIWLRKLLLFLENKKPKNLKLGFCGFCFKNKPKNLVFKATFTPLVWRPLAKKSTANQRKEQCRKSTFSGLQRFRWHYEYLHRLSSCCLPNVRNPAKFELSSSSRSSKVIDLGANEKRIYDTIRYDRRD